MEYRGLARALLQLDFRESSAYRRNHNRLAGLLLRLHVMALKFPINAGADGKGGEQRGCSAGIGSKRLVRGMRR